jgi:hypothetical protein
MRARQIMVLVTGAALNRIHSVPIGSAPDLHRVLMAVVSLARKVSGGVTIHAARMAQYRNDSLKRSSRTTARRYVLHCDGFCTFGLRSGIECQQEGG